MGNSRNIENWAWKLSSSLWDKTKKITTKIWDFLHNVFLSENLWYGCTYRKNWKYWISGLVEPKYDGFMLCWDRYIWAQIWDKRKLLDEEGKEIYEVDEVKALCIDYTSGSGIEEWKIFRKWSQRWMVANNWVIIPPKCNEMFFSERIEGNYLHSIAIWKEILENWEIKQREISVEDGSVREYVEPIEEDDIDTSGRFKGKYIDSLYNNVLKEKITTYEWWKKHKLYTYMENGKIWIKWILEPQYDAIYLPFRWYSVAIVRLWEKFWLISAKDWSIFREIEYDNIIEDEKTKSLILLKWSDIEKIYCDNFKESKPKKKAD